MIEKHISLVSLLVRDYDEAIHFYTEKMGFSLGEDTDLGEGKRWVRITPTSQASFSILLAKAQGEAQKSRIGNQTGGRVFLFLQTQDFWQSYKEMEQKGVHFLEDPREENYGTVAVFEDLYGNKWDLLQLNK
ncbi:MAG: VOC family protein [Bacteroidota bacterium]